MSEEWISAANALAALQPTFSEYSARMLICERAHAGMIRAQAKQLEIGRKVSQDVEIPKAFWWGKGHHALKQNWVAGDFSTWIDRSVEWKAFGVQFVHSDIENLLPPGNRLNTTERIFSSDDIEIIGWLETISPESALSYRQCVLDIMDQGRVSFRGTAAELRETLREVIDHLAPDSEVQSQTGYSHEKDKTKPTHKQKVRYIMKVKGRASSSETPEQALTAFDEAVSMLTRSVYERASAAVHGVGDRNKINQIRRFAVAVFYEILRK